MKYTTTQARHDARRIAVAETEARFFMFMSIALGVFGFVSYVVAVMT